jgi:hypothetical protein
MGRLLKPYRSVVLMDGMNIFMVLSIGDDSLLELYEAGEITYDTAANNSYDPAALYSRIHKQSLPQNE